LSDFAGLALAIFALVICDIAGICCVRMTSSNFAIFEPHNFDDK
jgi:hypothetical protein